MSWRLKAANTGVAVFRKVSEKRRERGEEFKKNAVMMKKETKAREAKDGNNITSLGD